MLLRRTRDPFALSATMTTFTMLWRTSSVNMSSSKKTAESFDFSCFRQLINISPWKNMKRSRPNILNNKDSFLEDTKWIRRHSSISGTMAAKKSVGQDIIMGSSGSKYDKYFYLRKFYMTGNTFYGRLIEISAFQLIVLKSSVYRFSKHPNSNPFEAIT